MTMYIIVVHTALIAGLFFMPILLPLQLGTAVLLLTHLNYSLWRYSSKAVALWVERVEYRQHHWRITRNGVSTAVQLTQVTVWRWLVIMNFIIEDSQLKQSLVILPDSADKDTLRKLRVILRHFPIWDKTAP